MFGSLVLVCSREAVDLSRVGQPSGMAFLADHNGGNPIGKVRRTSVKGGYVYASVDLVSTTRSEPYLEELRGGLRDGTSPGFLVHAAEITEMDDGEVLARITLWEPYEISSTPIPRNPNVGLLRLDGSPSNKSASNEGASGVDLSAETAQQGTSGFSFQGAKHADGRHFGCIRHGCHSPSACLPRT